LRRNGLAVTAGSKKTGYWLLSIEPKSAEL